MSKNFCVYMHTNKINGKKYIGQTCQDFNKRCGHNGCNYKRCLVFYNAIQKYGWDNFEHKILFDGLTSDEANEKETELIRFYKTQNRDFGYNVKKGGNHGEFPEEIKEKIRQKKIGQKLSEETKDKLRKSSTGRFHTQKEKDKISKALKEKYSKEEYHWSGKKHKEETKQKISASNKGKRFSNEHRNNLSKALKGKFLGENNPLFGKNHTEEAKMKMSKAKKGVYMGTKNWNSKPVIQYDLQGNFIKEWEYISLASKELDICLSSIGQCCKGKLKKAGGFVWKYKEAENGNSQD